MEVRGALAGESEREAGSGRTQPGFVATYGAFAPVVASLIWSGNTIVTKSAYRVIAPESIAFYRWSIAFLVLVPIVGPAAWRNRRAALAHWPKLATLAALGMVIYQSIAYQAGKTTTAVNMSVIIALSPIMAALLASAFAGEPLTRQRVLGSVISFAGLIFLTSHGQPTALLSDGLHVGDALMVVATFANAVYGVLLKRWSLPLPLGQQLIWQIGFAVLLLAPVWLLGTISPIDSSNLPLVLYAAIPTSLAAPFFWMVAIQRIGAARSALYINIMPIIVALLAWLILGETLAYYHYIGGTLALFGVALGVRQAKGAD